MRFPQPRRRQKRSKTIIMSGGLNDIVTNLELKEGELHRVKNYMELDSAYHGYSSISGYEVFDGKTSPSLIGAPQIEDSGVDDYTVFLLECPTGAVDVSTNGFPLTDSGVSTQSLYTRFGDYAWAFQNKYFLVDSEVGTETLNLGDNWTIDFQYRRRGGTGTETLFEKSGCYKLDVDVTGRLTFYTSPDGISYSDSVDSGDMKVVSTEFRHVSIRARDKEMAIAISGVPSTLSGTPVTTTYTTLNTNTNSLYIGCDTAQSTYSLMFMDEFRISSTYRWESAFETPEVRYTTEKYWVVAWDDRDRETQRAKITEVGNATNACEGPVLGVHIYGGKVYALRNLVAGGAGLFQANRIPDGSGGYTDASGWVLVDTFTNQDGRMVAFNWRFSGSFSDQQVMVIVDGANIPRIWDGSTMTVLNTSYNGGVASNLPDNQVTPRYAKTCASYDNRILFGYEADDIFMSSSADPGDFSGGFGAQFLVGDSITNLVNLPKESMAVICRNSIQVITQLSSDPSVAGLAKDYWFRLDRYSREAGGFEHTAQRILGDILYADDRGIVSFKATDTFADFDLAAISKKVNRVYLAKKNNITSSLVDKELNQYRIFFDDGQSIWFTFQEESLKGATLIEYPIPVSSCCEGEDPTGNIWKFFTTTDATYEGYVFQMDSGTSFNNEEIEAFLYTAFYSYGSPRQWKTFYGAVFEATAQRATKFNIRPVFDYDSALFPDTLWWEHTDQGIGGIWDTDYYGTFAWGEGVISRIPVYIRGYATNMSLEIRTLSKYNTPHIIHNAIVDYEVNEFQQ